MFAVEGHPDVTSAACHSCPSLLGSDHTTRGTYQRYMKCRSKQWHINIVVLTLNERWPLVETSESERITLTIIPSKNKQNSR
jgi:hypothetical protein